MSSILTMVDRRPAHLEYLLSFSADKRLSDCHCWHFVWNSLDTRRRARWDDARSLDVTRWAVVTSAMPACWLVASLHLYSYESYCHPLRVNVGAVWFDETVIIVLNCLEKGSLTFSTSSSNGSLWSPPRRDCSMRVARFAARYNERFTVRYTTSEIAFTE